MKKYALIFAIILSFGAYGAESAGVSGMVITNDTVRNNNFVYPRNIHTIYFPNDPSEGGVFLAYVVYKKIGIHRSSIEFIDKNGNKFDGCQFEPTNVQKIPWVQTMSCRWGGRQSDGGITFVLSNSLNGKTERIAELFLPAKVPE